MFCFVLFCFTSLLIYNTQNYLEKWQFIFFKGPNSLEMVISMMYMVEGGVASCGPRCVFKEFMSRRILRYFHMLTDRDVSTNILSANQFSTIIFIRNTWRPQTANFHCRLTRTHSPFGVLNWQWSLQFLIHVYMAVCVCMCMSDCSYLKEYLSVLQSILNTYLLLPHTNNI